VSSATCPACFETPGDPALDMDANHWHAHHAARFLADDARALVYLRGLPHAERDAACTALFELGLAHLARAAMLTGRADAGGPLPFELERLSEPT